MSLVFGGDGSFAACRVGASHVLSAGAPVRVRRVHEGDPALGVALSSYDARTQHSEGVLARIVRSIAWRHGRSIADSRNSSPMT